MESYQTEPQINADERRLNALSQENMVVATEKDCGKYLNLCRNAGISQSQPRKIRKTLTFIIGKSGAINLRLSAFICGLKRSYNSKQQIFDINIINKSLFLFSIPFVHFLVNLQLIEVKGNASGICSKISIVKNIPETNRPRIWNYVLLSQNITEAGIKIS